MNTYRFHLLAVVCILFTTYKAIVFAWLACQSLGIRYQDRRRAKNAIRWRNALEPLDDQWQRDRVAFLAEQRVAMQVRSRKPYDRKESA